MWKLKEKRSLSNKQVCVKLKGAVMQIEKTLINDHLRVSQVSWKFHSPTIYNFAVIYS